MYMYMYREREREKYCVYIYTHTYIIYVYIYIYVYSFIGLLVFVCSPRPRSAPGRQRTPGRRGCARPPRTCYVVFVSVNYDSCLKQPFKEIGQNC